MSASAESGGGGKRLGVVGTLVWDTIHGRDPAREGPVQEWGGIAYALSAFEAAGPGGWTLVPIIKVGKDMRRDARELLEGLGRVGSLEAVRFVDEPVGGSNETVMKTSYGFNDKRHATRLGALGRHISDFADPDANWFVILGGQDGWLGSENFLDQYALWRRGEYVQVPLRPESARTRFRHHVRLMPRGAATAPKAAAD